MTDDKPKCEHSEVEYLDFAAKGVSFYYRCLGCNRVGESYLYRYQKERRVKAKEGDTYWVYKKRRD